MTNRAPVAWFAQTNWKRLQHGHSHFYAHRQNRPMQLCAIFWWPITGIRFTDNNFSDFHTVFRYRALRALINNKTIFIWKSDKLCTTWEWTTTKKTSTQKWSEKKHDTDIMLRIDFLTVVFSCFGLVRERKMYKNEWNVGKFTLLPSFFLSKAKNT